MAQNIHVQGPPYKLLIDKDKNMWIAVYGQGLYYHNAKTRNTYLLNLPKGSAGLSERGKYQ